MLDDLLTTRRRLFAGDTHALAELERSIDYARRRLGGACGSASAVADLIVGRRPAVNMAGFGLHRERAVDVG